ncbi:MAG: hypothetical protein WCF26_05465 [Candidatus Sulfotelmatobacter sp.]|jgi:hypothetical protein
MPTAQAEIEPVIPTLDETEERTVTYQITARLADGMVIASDQAERHVSADLNYGVPNLVAKIRIDPSGQYAWAYSGGLVAPMFSAELFQNMSTLHSTGNPISRVDVEKAMTDCFDPIWTRWQELEAAGPTKCVLVMACGPTKEILRWNLNRPHEVQLVGSPCFSGQEFTLSAFLPKYLYSPQLTVSEFALLAAHSIQSGHDLDSALIDGLDIAVYRDATGRFEFLDSAYYWQEAIVFTSKLKQLLTHRSPAVIGHIKP